MFGLGPLDALMGVAARLRRPVSSNGYRWIA